MAEPEQLHEPWLIALWPGMGSVAIGAGTYLLQQLGAEPVGELAARDLMDIEQVEVEQGVSSAHVPRNLLFAWKDPNGRRDLLIMLGEAQPSVGRYALANRLLDYAERHDVKRVCTFAAMATMLQPGDPPRVFGCATDAQLVDELRRLEVEVLEEGQISGMNGVLLPAAAERGMDGVCLLGELPYFAVGVANPRASMAALQALSSMAGIEIDLSDLEEQADQVDQQLQEAVQKMSDRGEQDPFAMSEFPTAADTGEEDEEEEAEDERSKPSQPELSAETKQRIEQLFQKAQRDRSKATELKRELDSHGVFKQYEDRFLDLFKRGE